MIKFTRSKELWYIKELGHGACGRTVLLYDDVIEQHFVCKKYSPSTSSETVKKKLFQNFVREIKLLHLLSHSNVVRVFNYYLYPDKLLGYIMMEYVQGTDIKKYLSEKPEQINHVFMQTIEGFAYLEDNQILHRDIRPLNLLVSNDGVVKIIDFGFGKQVSSEEDCNKSITLNWCYETPSEFSIGLYNYTTEVYFVGKLFEDIIKSNQIEQFFGYSTLLSRMCKFDYAERIASFSEIRDIILTGKFENSNFSDSEKLIYRCFADQLSQAVSQIKKSAKYVTDPDDILRQLRNCYQNMLLEQWVTNNSLIIQCFIRGSIQFSTGNHIEVSKLQGFIELLQSCSNAKQNIIISNLHTRLNNIKRYSKYAEFDDDIPF